MQRKIQGSGGPALGGPALAVLAAGVAVLAIHETWRYQHRPGMDIAHYGKSGSLGNRARAAGITRVLAFDRPGQLAYLDDLDVIAVDGLTTNIEFQRRLRDGGIGRLIEAYKIHGFVGPSYEVFSETLCERMYLKSVVFHCDTDRRMFTGASFYSRLDGAFIGDLALSPLERVDYTPSRELIVYKLPAAGRP